MKHIPNVKYRNKSVELGNRLFTPQRLLPPLAWEDYPTTAFKIKCSENLPYTGFKKRYKYCVDETYPTTAHRVLDKNYQSCVFGLDVANMGIGMLKTLCLHRCDTCALSISVTFGVDKSNRNTNATNTNTSLRYMCSVNICHKY